ncbi:MAG: hypothetical protein Q9228_007881 [Teloschistes exilis]
MVLIAIIRISQVHTRTYNVWATFWQQLEGCVAILMVSLTAFRTLFVSSPHSSAAEREKAKRPSGGEERRRLWYKYKVSSEGKGSGSIPCAGMVHKSYRAVGTVHHLLPARGTERAKEVDVSMPSATLTGMRTFIRGSPRASSMMAAPAPAGSRDPRHHTIRVTSVMEWDSDSVSRALANI